MRIEVDDNLTAAELVNRLESGGLILVNGNPPKLKIADRGARVLDCAGLFRPQPSIVGDGPEAA